MVQSNWLCQQLFGQVTGNSHVRHQLCLLLQTLGIWCGISHQIVDPIFLKTTLNPTDIIIQLISLLEIETQNFKIRP